jgi:hypothetical protein
VFKKKTGSPKSRKAFGDVSKWNILYIVLALLVLFSLIAVPQITMSVMNRTKGQIVTVQTE